MIPRILALTLLGLALAGCQSQLTHHTSPTTAEKPAQRPQPPEGPLENPKDILKYYPAFTVASREEVMEDESDYYPCSDCHADDDDVDTEERDLYDEHEDHELAHGRGRFWCLTCHDQQNRDVLTSLKGQAIGFDDSYLLCGQCHFDKQRDFFYGAHGKRLGNWRGERELETCVACHDPHKPAIQSRAPKAAPVVRTGLPQPKKGHTHHHPWELIKARRDQQKQH